MGSPAHIINEAQLGVIGELREIVFEDLAARGLTNASSFGVTMSGHGAWQPLTTDRGRLLLDFVQLLNE